VALAREWRASWRTRVGGVTGPFGTACGFCEFQPMLKSVSWRRIEGSWSDTGTSPTSVIDELRRFPECVRGGYGNASSVTTSAPSALRRSHREKFHRTSRVARLERHQLTSPTCSLILPTRTTCIKLEISRPTDRYGGGSLVESEVLLQAQSIDRERDVHRHIGDFTLFMAGLFPEYLRRLKRPG